MLFPSEYVWLVFVSTMDIIFTWIIISRYEGHEANPLADFYIRTYGSAGLIFFKFCIVILVVGICEIVGRQQEHTGRRLARASVAISSVPMIVSIFVVIDNWDAIMRNLGI